MKNLYKKFLYKDKTFHYFNEGEVIIIRGEDKILRECQKSLRGGAFMSELYDYPIAPKGKYGDSKGGITTKYEKYFLPMYHILCEAFLTMPKKQWWSFLKKSMHGAFNIQNISHFGEMYFLSDYVGRTGLLMEKILDRELTQKEVDYMLK